MNSGIFTLGLLALGVAAAWLVLATGGASDRDGVERHLLKAQQLIAADWPVGVEDRATTSGAVYLANLDGQIDVLEARLAGRQDDLLAAHLARLLYHRFQVLGRLEDGETARARLASVVSAGNPGVALDYARVLIGFHDFELALRVIDDAALNGADTGEAEALRRAIAQARGLAAPADSTQDVSPPSALDLVEQAAQWHARGRPDKASALLRLAQDLYADSSPFTLAWIHVQQGIVFLEHGYYESARRFFAAAHERFPQYTLAAEHLAETELALGRPERAAELYQQVAGISGHPEFYHQLARAETLLGRGEEARAAAASAREGYAQLVSRHPLMFADHAVAYYVDIGERERAVALAEANLNVRQDRRSLDLLLTARECCP